MVVRLIGSAPPLSELDAARLGTHLRVVREPRRVTLLNFARPGQGASPDLADPGRGWSQHPSDPIADCRGLDLWLGFSLGRSTLGLRLRPQLGAGEMPRRPHKLGGRQFSGLSRGEQPGSLRVPLKLTCRLGLHIDDPIFRVAILRQGWRGRGDLPFGGTSLDVQMFAKLMDTFCPELLCQLGKASTKAS
jgi:hypothetical protein